MTVVLQGDGAGTPDVGRAAPVASAAKAYFTGPWLAVAVAMSALALASVLDSSAVLIYLAMVGYLVLKAPEASVPALLRWAPALTLAFLALASSLWSEAPAMSIRLGGMLLLTLAGAIVMADRVTPAQFVGAAFCALMTPTLGSLFSDNYQPSVSGMALAGLFGSKNALAYTAMTGVLMALATVLDSRQPPLLRWFALVCVPLSLIVLALTKSVGATVSGVFGVSLFLALLAIRALPPRGRLAALLAAAVLATPVAINWRPLQEIAQDFQVTVLKRDQTLTGRTYLWERSAPIIAARPVVGHGYASFWRQGTLDAEGLWRYAGIKSRSGFNFHNDYIDTAVALGYVGVVVLVLTMIGLALPLFVRVLFAPSIPLAALAASVAYMYLRTGTESGLIAAWTFSTVVLYAAAVYGRRGDGPSPGEPAGDRPAG